MKNKLQLLLHPVFILSLACLILNDLYWKYEYHNWVTGKLSDFTGLFVLSVFLCAFIRRNALVINIGIIIFFIWWKSPLSQPIIDLINRTFSLSFHRVVDYSDYIALPIVFASHFLKPVSTDLTLPRKLAVYFISGVSFVAFCSTSMIRKFTIAPDLSNRISFHEEYKTKASQADILQKLDSLKWNYKIDSFTTVPLNIYGGSLLIRRKDSLDKNWMVIDPMQKDTLVYVRINERRPYIAINNFNANGIIFPQINIAVNDLENKNTILLESVFLNDTQRDEYYNKRSKTKIRIRKLLQKELISKLQ